MYNNKMNIIKTSLSRFIFNLHIFIDPTQIAIFVIQIIMMLDWYPKFSPSFYWCNKLF